MSRREEYVQKMQAKLEEWNAEIDRLEARARQSSAQMKQDYARQMAALREQRDQAKVKLHEIRDASEDAWETLTEGADEAWNRLRRTLRETRDAFSGKAVTN